MRILVQFCLTCKFFSVLAKSISKMTNSMSSGKLYINLSNFTCLTYWLIAVAMMAMTPRVGSPNAEQCSSMMSCPKWGKRPHIARCPCRHSLHGCYQSISSSVFPWGGDHVYARAEEHVDIAQYACDSHDQSMSVWLLTRHVSGEYADCFKSLCLTAPNSKLNDEL